MNKIDLSGGGLIVVAFGNPVTIKEYENHSSAKWLKTTEITKDDLPNHIPVNTRLIIMNEGVPHYHYLWLTQQAQKMKIVWLWRKSSNAIYEILKEHCSVIQKATIEEVKETQAKGRLASLLPFVDWTKSNAENARELMNKALELGIKTTEGSLQQFVSIKRRELGQSGIVKSIRSKLDVSVDMLDSMIKELSDMRDFLIETVEENKILKRKVEKFRSVMEE